MRFPISYEDAKMRHPTEVAATVRFLRGSSSMQRATAPAALEWFYTVAVQLGRPKEGSLEEQVRDRLSRSRAFLHAKVGRWNHSIELRTLPPEWERHTRELLGRSV